MRSRPHLSLAVALVALAVVIGLVVAALTDSLWWSPGQPSDASRVSGFKTVAFTISGRRGCALLAQTEAERGIGLMNRRDLAGYDAMIFLWPAPTTEAFYMKDTLIPLSIAWFDQSTHFVSETDMAPCPPAVVSCPLFSAAAPYTVAVEVPEGGLPGLGIGPGSSITLGGACR
jgi:uncharacterized membrane protein (UPF0127 family)